MDARILKTVAVAFALAFTQPIAATPPADEVLRIGEAESVRTLRVDAELTFDTAGKVTSQRIITPNLPDGIRRVAEEKLASLEFEPVRVDGRLVAARTFARMTFVAREQAPGRGDGYEVAIENIRFHQGKLDSYGDPVRSKQEQADAQLAIDQRGHPIRYPKGLERAGVSGAVMLQLLLRPDGTVERVQAVQSALFNVNGRERLLEQARKLFEEQATRTVMSWQFKLPPATRDEADAMPDNQALLPIFFTMTHHKGLNDPGQWRIESRSAVRAPAWGLNPGGQRMVGISDVTGEEGALSLAQNRIRLKTPAAVD